MFAGTGLSLAHGRNVQSQDSPLALRARYGPGRPLSLCRAERQNSFWELRLVKNLK